MTKRKIKDLFDKFYDRYAKKDFIEKDPISFPHRYKDKKDIETAGIIAAFLAFGNRKSILPTVGKLLEGMSDSPYNYISFFDYKKGISKYKNFVYRYIKGDDLVVFFYILKKLYEKYVTLEKLFMTSYDGKSILPSLNLFKEEVKSITLPEDLKHNQNSRMLLACFGNSAQKRLNMFLRWMVRNDKVDLGIYKGISPSTLIIPLDTHVARISRLCGLTKRKSNDMKTAIEITEKLKVFSTDDPVKYDFAMFGFGVDENEKCITEYL